MNAGSPSPELIAALQEKLALLKDLRCERAMTANVARLFQLEMQLEQCRLDIQSLAQQIDPSITPGAGAPD